MGAMRACVRVAAGLMLVAGCWGCRKAPPPPPPPAEAPTDPPPPDPEPVPQTPAEQPAPESTPQVQKPQRPEIPDHPVRGQIDGIDFEVSRVTRLDATVLISGVDGRGVTLALFGSPGPFEILEEPGFGAPHVYVRSPQDAPAKGYVTEYRMIYDEAQGLLWLQLPDDRGTIAGRFTIE